MEISAATIHELQIIQDAFAKQLKIAMIITDSNGIYITNPSLPAKQNAQFEKEILYQFVSKMSRFDKDDLTFIADTPYTPVNGLKCILSTFAMNSRIYILWAGPLLTKGMKEISIHQLSFDQKCYEDYLSSSRDISSEEMAALIQNMEEIKKVIKKNIDYDCKHHKVIQQFSLIENLFSLLEIEDFFHFFHEAANGFLESNDEISFIGYAEKCDPFQYRINKILGNYNEHLLNDTFLMGEGFLGQAASSGQFFIWNYMKSDERAAKFSKSGLPLQSLFCFQIKNEDQVDIIVFGGSFQKGIDDSQASLLRILFSMFRNYETQEKLKQELMVSQTRLNILKDISIILSEIKDINRVLYLLMDISINLVKGGFTCVFLNKSEYFEQPKMVSRGLSAENISTYGNYLKKKYFSNERILTKQPVFIQTPWLDTVFECPLKQEDEIIGIFSVQVKDEQAYEEYSPLLTSFARLCGFAMQLLIHDEMKIVDDEKIKLLANATEHFNSSAYQMILEAKTILVDFISYLQLNDKIRDLCVHSLFLSAYRAEFLDKQSISKKIVQIVDEFNVLQEDRQKEAISLESQIVYIVLSYLQNYRSGKTAYPDNLDLTLIEKFDDFLLRMKTKESIISDHEQEDLKIQPNLKKVKNQYHLSEREEDVLNLILKGISNKEIGEKLFISEHTVKNHLTNIFRKLDVKDRSQAISKSFSIGYQYVED